MEFEVVVLAVDEEVLVLVIFAVFVVLTVGQEKVSPSLSPSTLHVFILLPQTGHTYHPFVLQYSF